MAVCEGRALNLPDVGVRAPSSSGAGSIGDPTTRQQLGDADLKVIGAQKLLERGEIVNLSNGSRPCEQLQLLQLST